MKNLVLITLAVCSVLIFNSCNKDLDKVLFGTWSVTKVEGTLNVNGSSVFSGVDENPVGTVEFKNNGKGEQNYSFTFNGSVYPQTGTFTWRANEDEIVIDRVSDPDMIWIRIINSDNKQKVSHNIVVDANQNWDYTLTLEK
mgnify:CR=1 FL=1